MVSLIKREYDYGIRVSAYLASLYPEGGRTIRELAKLLSITPSLTTRISYQLIKGGVLRSRKGRKGGVFLAVDPRKLSLMDILKAMDYNSTMNACLVEESICPLTGICPIRRKFELIDTDIQDKFRETRLSELVISDAMLN